MTQIMYLPMLGIWKALSLITSKTKYYALCVDHTFCMHIIVVSPDTIFSSSCPIPRNLWLETSHQYSHNILIKSVIHCEWSSSSVSSTRLLIHESILGTLDIVRRRSRLFAPRVIRTLLYNYFKTSRILFRYEKVIALSIDTIYTQW